MTVAAILIVVALNHGTKPASEGSASVTAQDGPSPISTPDISGILIGPDASRLDQSPIPALNQTNTKAESLVAAMTLDEKIGLLHGSVDPDQIGAAGFMAGVPRLGIPVMRLADGPAGVRIAGSDHRTSCARRAGLGVRPELGRSVWAGPGGSSKSRRRSGCGSCPDDPPGTTRVPQAGRNFEKLQ